jgi:hypothetical protein
MRPGGAQGFLRTGPALSRRFCWGAGATPLLGLLALLGLLPCCLPCTALLRSQQAASNSTSSLASPGGPFVPCLSAGTQVNRLHEGCDHGDATSSQSPASTSTYSPASTSTYTATRATSSSAPSAGRHRPASRVSCSPARTSSQSPARTGSCSPSSAGASQAPTGGAEHAARVSAEGSAADVPGG